MRRIIVTGARAPVALHWARLLSAAGHRVVLADSLSLPIARFTRLKQAYIRLPPPSGNLQAYGDAWRHLLAAEKPDLVLPTCEEVFFLAALRDRHGLDMPLFAPAFDLLAGMHNKFEFARRMVALDAPVRPPETWLVRSFEEMQPLLPRSGELVLKPVWSRFGDRVLRRPSEEALRRMDWSKGGPWAAQHFLPGEELSAYGLAYGGRLLAHRAYRGLFRASGGASVAFAPLDEPEIAAFMAAFVAETRWHGQVSFDFRRDEKGKLHVIECNPRAVSGLHFFGCGDGLEEALFGRGEARPGIASPQTMRLALLTYGLGDALGSGRAGEWWHCLRDASDLTRWPGDRNFLLPQGLALLDILAIALRTGIGLKAAATADIEWNGEAL